MQELEAYEKAKEAILKHVGLETDRTEYVIGIDMDSYWTLVSDRELVTADKRESLDPSNHDGDSPDDCYEREIFYDPFYQGKFVRRGEDYTLIFATQNIDGMRYRMILDNKKEVV